MRSERRWLLGGNLLTSLSIALGYPLTLIAQGKNEMMMSQIRVEAEGERKRIWQLQQRSYQPETEDC